jgi:hypothetical protein
MKDKLFFRFSYQSNLPIYFHQEVFHLCTTVFS